MKLSRRDLLAALAAPAIAPATAQTPFLLGRNATGRRPAEFQSLFEWARESGEKLVRIHVTIPDSFEDWDSVLDMAAAHGLAVLPVLGVWSQWNEGSKGETWHYWERNPYNQTAERPIELFQDTPCRKAWLEWLGKMVARWQARPNIFGWEIFSELDLVTGSTEPAAVDFVEHAASVIRSADERRRPVTASLSGLRDWPRLFQSAAIDLVQVHPYGRNLDELILSSVRKRLRDYRKPVLIGECGLDARPPINSLTTAERAYLGVRHGIWASAVSGAMNGRMLWWEDGFDIYTPGLDLRGKYRHAAQPVARFVQGVDYSPLHPLEIAASPEIKGAALGDEQLVLAWFRDAGCVPPSWPVRRVERQTVDVPAGGGRWKVTFYDTATGEALHTARCDRRVPLPPFQGSIAFRCEKP